MPRNWDIVNRFLDAVVENSRRKRMELEAAADEASRPRREFLARVVAQRARRESEETRATPHSPAGPS